MKRDELLFFQAAERTVDIGLPTSGQPGKVSDGAPPVGEQKDSAVVTWNGMERNGAALSGDGRYQRLTGSRRLR